MELTDHTGTRESIRRIIDGLPPDEIELLFRTIEESISGPGPRLGATDLVRAIRREDAMVRSRREGQKGGRPNILNSYVDRYNEAKASGNDQVASSVHDEVKDRVSRSSYSHFCKRVGIRPHKVLRKGRPPKLADIGSEYNEHMSIGDNRGAKRILERARAELSQTSYRKLRADLGLLDPDRSPGRPSKISLYRQAYIDNLKTGRKEYADSILDYARTKLSRSSYFKLKRELAMIEGREGISPGSQVDG